MGLLIAAAILALLFVAWYSPNTARRRAVDEGKEIGGVLDSIRRAIGGSTANTRSGDRVKEPLDNFSAKMLVVGIVCIPLLGIIYVIWF